MSNAEGEFSTVQAAAMLGVKPRRMQQLAREIGKVPYFGQFIWTSDELRELASRNTKPGRTSK